MPNQRRPLRRRRHRRQRMTRPIRSSMTRRSRPPRLDSSPSIGRSMTTAELQILSKAMGPVVTGLIQQAVTEALATERVARLALEMRVLDIETRPPVVGAAGPVGPQGDKGERGEPG